jgi:hypothetical protein
VVVVEPADNRAVDNPAAPVDSRAVVLVGSRAVAALAGILVAAVLIDNPAAADN